MGANPYWYFEKYNEDINQAVEDLRRREFEAGRYFPAMSMFPGFEFPVTAQSPAPGAKHASIDEAREAAAECGTQSILDLDEVTDYPELGSVSPLPDDALVDLFGTNKPTREMAEKNLDFFDYADRLLGIYFIIYENDAPYETLFAGYSVD